jgi:hypothetical protein
VAKIHSKTREIIKELEEVFLKKYKLIDFIAPPLIFLLAASFFSFTWGLILSFLALSAFLIWRLIKGEPLVFLLVGFLGVVIASVYAWLSSSLVGFYLPDILTDGLVVLACLISLVLKRPLAAYTSFISRRWPINWYWHPRIRPAYTEVTFFWLIFFGLKFILGLVNFSRGNLESLALINILTGWPAILVVLVVSYLYGLKRLKSLRGPSVNEFKKGRKPPWQGQKKGF